MTSTPTTPTSTIRDGRRPVTRMGDWLPNTAQRSPDAICFDDRGTGEQLTFREVNLRVNRLANAMLDLGLTRSDAVAILATDSHRYMETILACAKIGLTYVPLNFRLSEPEIGNLIGASRASALFVSERYLPIALRLVDTAPTLRHVIGFEGDGSTALSFEGLVKDGSEDEPDADVQDEDIVSIAFTSGTTGRPKGVLQSQRMLKSMVLSQVIDMEMRPGDCMYSASPIFHVAGIGMVLMGVVRGYTTVLMPSFDPRAVLDALKGDDLSVVFLVPSMINAVLSMPDAQGGAYSRLRLVAYGASPMPPSLLRQAFETFGCDFVQFFGAGTEAGFQALLNKDDHRRAATGDEHLLESVGKPALNSSLRLCDGEWNDVSRGEVGEIVTRGDMVMSGYFEDPETTAESMRDGWFRAGDLAWQDEEGFVYLAGRKKDMIIRGGENVYPIEIETVLHGHPGVFEVAVVGQPDEHFGEIIKAVVVMKAGVAVPDDTELRDFAAAQLAKYKVPTVWEFRETLPKNASGKILKAELRA